MHCTPLERTQGANLFLAGKSPIGNRLYLFTANNAAHAQIAKDSNNYAWFVPLSTSKRNRFIDLPEAPTDLPGRPSPNHWAFPINDYPKAFLDLYDDAPTWTTPEGETWAWFEARESKITYNPKPQEREEPYVPVKIDLNPFGHVEVGI